MATPTKFNSVVTNPGGTGSTITPTLSTHASGDILEIFVTKTGNAAWSAPAGWSIRHQTSSPGTASTATVGTLLYRRVLPGDTLPLASPVCNLAATVTRHAICRTIRGADVEGVYILPEWAATATTSGTSNPIRPPSVTTPAPEMLVTHYYCQRVATNAPEPTGYTQDQQVITSGTLVTNISEKNVADQQTVLSNQDVSPTSGGRWVGMISCAPSPDYGYYRSGSQALVNGTSATPALPAGTSSSDNRGNKDLIIATVECAGTSDIAPNTPADWTEITEWANTTSGNGTTVRKYRALYDGTLDRQFNRSTSGEIFVYLSVYHNAHQIIPLSGAAVQQNASSTSGTWPAMVRTSTKATIQLTCVADATPTYTTPATWTERNDSQGVVCADQPFNATGTVASGSFTLNNSSPTLCGLLEVNSVASVIVVTLVPATITETLTTFAPALILVLIPTTSTLSVSGFAPTISVVGGGILTDDFNDNSRDTSKWTLGSIAFENAGVGVAEANQQIEISPLANQGAPAIYGYRSANVYDFTGRQAQVRIADSLASDIEAWLVVAVDANNYLRTWVAGGVLNTRSRVGASNSNVDHGTFNFSTQSHWRIRHDNGTDEIVWEVGDGTGWTELRRIARPLTITVTDFYLSGGTGTSVASPAQVKFDDFIMNALTLLIPATATLVIAAFTPSTQLALTPASTPLSLTQFTPSVVVTGGETVVIPDTFSLSITTFTPALVIRITPDSTTFTLNVFTASLVSVIIPTTASTTTSGFAASLITITTPTTATLTLSSLSPAVVTNTRLIPSTASLVTNTFEPSIQLVVLPGITSLSLTVFSLVVIVSEHVTVIDDPASLSLATFAPSLKTSLTPASTALAIESLAPSLTQTITPSAVSISLSTFAPAITVGVVVSPTSVALNLTSSAPALHETITINVANLTLAASAPLVMVGDDVVVGPITSNLVLASQAITLRDVLTPITETLTTSLFTPQLLEVTTPPTVALSISVTAPVLELSVTPTTVSLATSATSPALLYAINPALTTLTLTTFAPSSGGGQLDIVTPASATLTLAAFIPAVQIYQTPAPRIFVVESVQRTFIVSLADRVDSVPRPDREEIA